MVTTMSSKIEDWVSTSLTPLNSFLHFCRKNGSTIKSHLAIGPHSSKSFLICSSPGQGLKNLSDLSLLQSVPKLGSQLVLNGRPPTKTVSSSWVTIKKPWKYPGFKSSNQIKHDQTKNQHEVWSKNTSIGCFGCFGWMTLNDDVIQVHQRSDSLGSECHRITNSVTKAHRFSQHLRTVKFVPTLNSNSCSVNV